jgi:hypothetical protein
LLGKLQLKKRGKMPKPVFRQSAVAYLSVCRLSTGDQKLDFMLAAITNRALSRREHILRNQLRAMTNAMLEVNAKDCDGGSTNWCPTNQQWAIISKMRVPLVPARVEKPNDFMRLRIDSAQIWSAPMVASKAGQCKVQRVCRAPC